MKYNRLGDTGLLVSELSFGSWVTFDDSGEEGPLRETRLRKLPSRVTSVHHDVVVLQQNSIDGVGSVGILVSCFTALSCHAGHVSQSDSSGQTARQKAAAACYSIMKRAYEGGVNFFGLLRGSLHAYGVPP